VPGRGRSRAARPLFGVGSPPAPLWACRCSGSLAPTGGRAPRLAPARFAYPTEGARGPAERARVHDGADDYCDDFVSPRSVARSHVPICGPRPPARVPFHRPVYPFRGVRSSPSTAEGVGRPLGPVPPGFARPVVGSTTRPHLVLRRDVGSGGRSHSRGGVLGRGRAARETGMESGRAKSRSWSPSGRRIGAAAKGEIASSGDGRRRTARRREAVRPIAPDRNRRNLDGGWWDRY
jgi:hypothetical protein